MKNLFVFVPPVVPPPAPGQPPYYYGIYGIILSLMVICMSSAVIIAFNLTKKIKKIVYSFGCLLSICCGVYGGNMLHPLIAVAVGVVLIIISIFVYNKYCEGKKKINQKVSDYGHLFTISKS